jgi:asparagine synthase (glutamine-hydrolysing)
MCGLVGMFTPRGRQPERADIDAALSSIRHRGPDGFSDWRNADGSYHAGFARLAIIDLKGADQPLVDPRSGRVLFGNGEIYNYRELRAEAEQAGYSHLTGGDMETALSAMALDRDGFADRLNGMYAIAIYEPEAHELLLLRDRLGIKPLYWAETGSGSLIFASEIKALFATGLITPAIDEAAVNLYLAHGYVPEPMTLYRGVHKLPAGCRMRVSANGDRMVEKYWTPPVAAGDWGDIDDAAARMTDALASAVSLQLRSDVPVGTLLSGGLDSGLIVALAAARAGTRLHSFTVRFAGADYDETPLADAVADRWSAEHTRLTVEEDSIDRHLADLVWHADEPLADASLLPNHLVHALLGKEVRVVLNGTGGDELFAGYMRYFPQPVEQCYLKLPGPVRRNLVEKLVGTVSPMNAWRLARAEKFTGDPGGYLHDHTTYFPPPVRDLIGNVMTPPEAAQRRLFPARAHDLQTGMLAADIQSYLREDLLTLLDRTSMAHSVEGRVPFLDHDMVGLALSLPSRLRTPGGRQKGLERRMAEDFLPETVLNAPKRGFASPVTAWLRGDFSRTARQLLTAPRALKRGWWTRDGVERLFSDTVRHGHRIYALAMLEATVRLHAERPAGATSAPASTAELLDA